MASGSALTQFRSFDQAPESSHNMGQSFSALGIITRRLEIWLVVFRLDHQVQNDLSFQTSKSRTSTATNNMAIIPYHHVMTLEFLFIPLKAHPKRKYVVKHTRYTPLFSQMHLVYSDAEHPVQHMMPMLFAQ